MITSRVLPQALQDALSRRQPVLWINENWQPFEGIRASSALSMDRVYQADERLRRLAPVLRDLFPELNSAGGIIESSLYPADAFRSAVMCERHHAGRWLVKGDHALPVAGSIKARGGFYEVLLHAENLVLSNGITQLEDDPLSLISPQARRIFARQQISVGSTGNLGLSIGLIASALGFQVTVHMSSDAKEWKKARLRACGVDVVEHSGDYGAAVAAGRAEAERRQNAHFVDDENSCELFVGYAVGAIRLYQQLQSMRVTVDAEHPLFVYVPCGVGGAAGGITFGLRHLFGDNVHCFFAEPVASPSVLIRLASVCNVPLSVRDVGLDNRTEADGLAVAQASELVAGIMRHFVSGIYTVSDNELFQDLYLLDRTEGMRIEPSAAAGLRGARWLLQSDEGRRYLRMRNAVDCMHQATHIIWTTGGALVPDDEYRQFFERGRLTHLTS